MNEAETRAEHIDPALAAAGADAITDLGKPEQIAQVFTGFQRYLYERVQDVVKRGDQSA